MARISTSCLILLLFAAVPMTADAAECANPDALGTARVAAIGPSGPPVGRKHFAQTLPLARKEVVLTFDDGPWPGSTARVLDALGRECVRATFFLLGRNAAAHPDLARRILAEGHGVGYHSYSHPILSRMAPDRAEAEIDRGIAAVDTALYGKPGTAPRLSFFRFPGFASTSNLLTRLNERGMTVFGADLWASDWNPMSPDQQLRLVLDRLRTTAGGIVLFHDTKTQTAAMLPAFLRALKREGYRVVHVVPADGSLIVRPGTTVNSPRH